MQELGRKLAALLNDADEWRRKKEEGGWVGGWKEEEEYRSIVSQAALVLTLLSLSLKRGGWVGGWEEKGKEEVDKGRNEGEDEKVE